MKIFTTIDDPEVASLLSTGGIGVIRTDTLYGVVADAKNEMAVNRVYELKSRDETKSPIVLIGSTAQMFDRLGTPGSVAGYWPGKVSLIMQSSAAPLWIQRGNHSVAYRLPDNASLQNLLKLVGPLIAPSANPQGERPARTIGEAQNYFGEKVDFYVDGGMVEDESPSRLIRLAPNGEVELLR